MHIPLKRKDISEPLLVQKREKLIETLLLEGGLDDSYDSNTDRRRSKEEIAAAKKHDEDNPCSKWIYDTFREAKCLECGSRH